MTSAVLGDNVKSIGNYAFNDCISLMNLDLGSSLVTIGEYAFNRSSVSSITIPNSVTEIGKYCFAENTKLEKITIGNDCRELSEGIFSGCSALTSVVLNDGLEKIISRAFAFCKSLESISIPGTVVQIGETYYSSDKGADLPFYDCTALKSVRFEDGEKGLVLGANYYDGPSSHRCLFSYCPLEEVYIGRNISYQDVSSYNSKTFEERPGYYGYSAFYNQPKLTKVTISPAVTEIPAYLFYKNASLTMTTLPKVKKIGVSAFQECSKLTTLNLGEDLQVVGSNAFNGCKNVTKLTFPDATTTIGSRAFQDCSSVTEVTVGKGLKSIGANAFLNCKSFTALLLPNGFMTMGESAFEGCI